MGRERTVLLGILLASGTLACTCGGCDRTDADGDGSYTSWLGGDCNDSDPAIHPGASELCNGINDDCDWSTDEDPVDGSWVAYDMDGDGYTGPHGEDSCESDDKPAGDCDDGNRWVYPGAKEYCDEVDHDCDGAVDEDAWSDPPMYADLDGDGFGTDPVMGCTPGEGVAEADGDCDDADPTVSPGVIEVCGNTRDDDCDASTPDDCSYVLVDLQDHEAYTSAVEGTGLGARVATGDIDGDGALDLIAETWVFYGAEIGGAQSTADVDTVDGTSAGFGASLASSDLNQDGAWDVVVGDDQGALLYFGPDVQLQPVVQRCDAACGRDRDRCGAERPGRRRHRRRGSGRSLCGGRRRRLPGAWPLRGHRAAGRRPGTDLGTHRPRDRRSHHPG